MSSSRNGNSIGSLIKLSPQKTIRRCRSCTCSICSRIRAARVCTSVIRKGTRRRMFSAATNGCAASTCCIRWAGTRSVYRRNNTRLIPAHIRRSRRRKILIRSADRFRCSDSATIGTGKLTRPIRIISNGRSGFSCSFIRRASRTKPRCRSGGATVARRCSRTRRSMPTARATAKVTRESTVVRCVNGFSASRCTRSGCSRIWSTSTGRIRSKSSSVIGSAAAKAQTSSSPSRAAI